MSSVRTNTLSRAHQERLPYPLGLYWLRAQQARTPLDVYVAAEGILRSLTALLLADVVHGTWSDELDNLLRGGPERRGLERLSLGSRIALLRALVRSHAALSEPMLSGVDTWWSALDGAKGVLQQIVEARNVLAHRGDALADAEAAQQRRLAVGLVARLLREAPFLREIQLIHVEGAMRMQRGRTVVTVRRLTGATPYHALAVEAEWPAREFALEEARVYMGSSDGTRWVLNPFVHLEPGTSARAGHPQPCVLDSIDRRGRLKFAGPHGGDEVLAPLPDTAWEPIDWPAFLDARQEITAAWRQSLATPHRSLTFSPPSDLADGLRAGATLDNFRLVQKLGEGGAAVVWEVEDVDDGRTYALKILKADVASNEIEVRRFEQEVATLKRLHASGCTRVVGPVVSLRVNDGEARRVVLRMPIMGSNLKDHASELRAAGGTVGPEIVVPWLRAALEALAQIHAQGIVHRDVKPSNFLLDEAGQLFIADLGVARDDARREGLTRTGDVVGTDVYMAPEQRMGSRDVGPAADIYALALSIDELLTGKPSATPGKSIDGALGELLRRMADHDADLRPTAEAALAVITSWSSVPSTDADDAGAAQATSVEAAATSARAVPAQAHSPDDAAPAADHSHERSSQPAAAEKAPAPTQQGKGKRWLFGLAAFTFMCVAWCGVCSQFGMPLQEDEAAAAKRMEFVDQGSELESNVESMRAAMLKQGERGKYFDIGSPDLQRFASGSIAYTWEKYVARTGTKDQWDRLGWRTDELVRGVYWVETFQNDDGSADFMVHGVMDLDGDGCHRHVSATMHATADIYQNGNCF